MVLQRVFNKSNLNFEVEKRQLEYKGNKIDQWGTFRKDNDQYLAPVGRDYTVIQNNEIFKLPSLLIDNGTDIKFKESYAMDKGKRVYASFTLPKPIRIGRTDDIIETRMSITTMHGGGGLFAFLEAVRLVCTNGMTRAEKSRMISVRHSAGAPLKLEEAQKTLLGITAESEKFGNLMGVLAKKQLTTDNIQTVIENLFKDKKGDIYSSSARQNKARDILTRFEDNDGNAFPSQRGTAFNLYNAVTNYTDHGQTMRYNNQDDKEAILKKGILFGAGATFKFAALTEILNVLGLSYVK